jgi:hypothetical protein
MARDRNEKNGDTPRGDGGGDRNGQTEFRGTGRSPERRRNPSSSPRAVSPPPPRQSSAPSPRNGSSGSSKKVSCSFTFVCLCHSRPVLIKTEI